MKLLVLFIFLCLLISVPCFSQSTLKIGANIYPLVRRDMKEGTLFTIDLKLRPGRYWFILGPLSDGPYSLLLPKSNSVYTLPTFGQTPAYYAINIDQIPSEFRLSGLKKNNLQIEIYNDLPENKLPLYWQQNKKAGLQLPPWKISVGVTPALQLTWAMSSRMEIDFLQADRSVNFLFRKPGRKIWKYYPNVWDVPVKTIEFSQINAQFHLESVLPVGSIDGDAIKADPATILNWQLGKVRRNTREWFFWAGQNHILILLTKSYALQDLYLKRLAFFVEKTGFRNRIVSDSEISALHGWNGHDYAPSDIAQFYNQARAKNFPLHTEEKELLYWLLKEEILKQDSRGLYTPGQGALLGISEASKPDLRTMLLTHEAFHGLYFTSSEFRNYVFNQWKLLTPQAQNVWRRFLQTPTWNYDTQFLPLVINEFQAYALQQPTSQAAYYYMEKVIPGSPFLQKIEVPDSVLGEFLNAVRNLDAACQKSFGVSAGNIQEPLVLSNS